MSTDTALDPTSPAPAETPRPNYLNVAHGVTSWLLTKDHKRIALLYLVPVSLAFVLGSVFMVIVRLSLLVPNGTLVKIR